MQPGGEPGGRRGREKRMNCFTLQKLSCCACNQTCSYPSEHTAGESEHLHHKEETFMSMATVDKCVPTKLTKSEVKMLLAPQLTSPAI